MTWRDILEAEGFTRDEQDGSVTYADKEGSARFTPISYMANGEILHVSLGAKEWRHSYAATLMWDGGSYAGFIDVSTRGLPRTRSLPITGFARDPRQLIEIVRSTAYAVYAQLTNAPFD